MRKNQNGFAIPSLYIYGGIALLIVGLLVTIKLYSLRLDNVSNKLEAKETAHEVFKGQVKFMSEEMARDNKKLKEDLIASNTRWGTKYEDQKSRNNILWTNNERLRDTISRYSSAGEGFGIPADTRLVNCGANGKRFEESFRRHHNRISEGFKKFTDAVSRDVEKFERTIRERIAKPNSDCTIYRNNASEWARDRKTLD